MIAFHTICSAIFRLDYISISLYLYIVISIYISIFLSIIFYLSLYVSPYLSIYLSIYISINIYITCNTGDFGNKPLFLCFCCCREYLHMLDWEFWQTKPFFMFVLLYRVCTYVILVILPKNLCVHVCF